MMNTCQTPQPGVSIIRCPCAIDRIEHKRTMAGDLWFAACKQGIRVWMECGSHVAAQLLHFQEDEQEQRRETTY
jgi:hypothetical protein